MNPEPEKPATSIRMGRLPWVRIALPCMFILMGAFLFRLQMMVTVYAPSASSSYSEANPPPAVDTRFDGAAESVSTIDPQHSGEVDADVFFSGLLGP